MSKLALGRAKLASTVLPALGQEPPDKKRKTEDNATVDSAWDDDLDILLTQNMNKLDSIVASTQSAAQSGYDELATNCNDRSSHISANTVGTACRREAEEMRSDTDRVTASSTGKRLIGHGSGHSRSADCLNNLSSNISVPLVRKGSFSNEKSCTGSKDFDKQHFWTSQAKRATGSSVSSTNVVMNLHSADTMTTSTSLVRLDANVNWSKTKLTQITEECEHYKAEVCVLLVLVCKCFTLLTYLLCNVRLAKVNLI